MKGLILGKSPQNQTVEAFFAASGHRMHTLENVFALRELRGQVGAFTAVLPGDAPAVDFVILTQPPAPTPPSFGGHATRSLYTADKTALCAALNPGQAVAFLLDFEEESSPIASWRALTDAETLARQKHRVYCFARYIRTAEPGAEELYLRAREAGVIFVHYRQFEATSMPQSGQFALCASDGVLPMQLEAALLFADGGRRTGNAFDHCRAALRLWPQTPGHLPDERFFLAPMCTSRKGVFQLDFGLLAGRLMDGLRYIAAALATLEAPAAQTATVQGQRCALCYTCYRACPHAALQQAQNARQMECLQKACEGCGSCAAVCPGNAIRLGGDKPPEYACAPLLCLCCENSAAMAMQTVLASLDKTESAQIVTRTVPCGGSIGLEDITEGLLRHQKVLVATCMEGACRHFEGSGRAKRQCARLAEMLASVGLPPGRVRHLQTSHALPFVLKEELLAFLHEETAPKAPLEKQP